VKRPIIVKQEQAKGIVALSISKQGGLPKAKVHVDFGACATDKCKSMARAISESILPSKANPIAFFDLASAMRTLKGVADFLGTQVSRNPEKSEFSIMKNGVFVAINCTEESAASLGKIAAS